MSNFMPRFGEANFARINLSGVASVFLVFAALAAPARAADTAPARDVRLDLDERDIRTAGIITSKIEAELGSSSFTLPGAVVIPPQQQHIVAAPAGGLIESATVDVDETVKQGQAIAIMRSPEIVETQRLFLTALSELNLNEDRLRRSQQLFKSSALAERDQRVAETEAQNSRFKLDELNQILLLMGFSEADVETLRTTRRIRTSISIYAPVSGTVITRHAKTGERVQSAAPIVTIARLDPLWVNIQVPSTRLSAITQGFAVVLPAFDVKGRIIRIGRTVDPQTQSALAVAEIETGDGRVRPGLAVNVSVRLEQNGVAQWAAPPGSIVRHRDRTWAFVRTRSGFVARPVQVVAETPRSVSIRANLEENDEIATRGMLSLLGELAEADKD